VSQKQFDRPQPM